MNASQRKNILSTIINRISGLKRDLDPYGGFDGKHLSRSLMESLGETIRAIDKSGARVPLAKIKSFLASENKHAESQTVAARKCIAEMRRIKDDAAIEMQFMRDDAAGLKRAKHLLSLIPCDIEEVLAKYL